MDPESGAPLDGGATDTAPVAPSTDNQSVDNPQSGGGNPAWKEILDVLPTSLHGIVTPQLQKWDQGVEQRFQTVQSRYSPYNQFIEQGRTPEELMQGLQLMQMIATDPRSFYDRMTEHYAQEWGLNSGQGQGENDDWDTDPSANPEEPVNPLVQQLQQSQQELAQHQQTMASYLAAQVEQQQRAEADKAVEAEFSAITEKYGELDQQKVNLIISLALQNNMELGQAADQVFSLLGAQAQTQQSKPPVRVVPTTGGVPQPPPLRTANMTGKDRRSLVASILAQNATQ